MSDIHVLKANESTSFIQCDQGILYELSEQLKFRVPGYQFMPSYQNRMWDGYIRLIDRRSSTFPSGLIVNVHNLAQDLGYEISFSDGALPGIDVPKKEIEDYVRDLLNPELEERQYQFDTIAHAINEQIALLLSPTSSGKSFIFYAILRYLLEHDYVSKVLIVVPQTHLVDQLANDFADYSKHLEWDAEEHVHKIYAGKDKDTDKQIVISTWQSIHRKSKKWFAQFDGWICDEAHLATGTSLQKVSDKLVNAKYRIGATGSLNGEKVHEFVLIGSFGPVYNIVDTRELIDDGYLTDINIDCITLNYPDEIKKAFWKVMRSVGNSKKKYQKEIEFITENKKRNKFLTNLAKSRKGNTLMLFNRVKKHSKPFYEALKEACPDHEVLFIDGTCKPEEKQLIKEITEKQDNVIIVASYQIFSTGVNIKNLHNIIFAAPMKGKIKIIQSIGRLLRKHESKVIATVYDVVDDLRWGKSYRNYGILHFFKRVEIYSNEKFRYKLHKVSL
jgi:superfamily II DNA or RNA helicase